MSKRRGRPTTTAVETRLFAALLPRLERLAGDVWQLAQRHPALAADPALLAEARSLLRLARRPLAGEPGPHLLPRPIPEGTSLHGLAAALRQLLAAATLYQARRSPPAQLGPDVDVHIDAVNRMMALMLRETTTRVAKARNLKLPAGLDDTPDQRRT